MLLNTSCRQGKLQVTEDGFLQVASFGKLVWQVPCASVTAFEVKYGAMGSASIAVHAGETYNVSMLIKKDVERIHELFPQTPLTDVATIEKPQPPQQAVAPQSAAEPAPKQKPSWMLDWWEDDRKFTHIATYTKPRDLERDIERAYQNGWMIQGQHESGGQMSGKKIIAGAIIAGPVGMFLGAGKSKEKTTVTFVRTPEWIAARKQ